MRWRFKRCPHVWEEVSRGYSAWDGQDYYRLFCPFCKSFRKLNADKARAIINSQKVTERYALKDY